MGGTGGGEYAGVFNDDVIFCSRAFTFVRQTDECVFIWVVAFFRVEWVCCNVVLSCGGQKKISKMLS